MNIADRILSTLGGASTAITALLIDTGAVTKAVGVDIGTVVAAIVVSWHASAYVSQKRADKQEAVQK